MPDINTLFGRRGFDVWVDQLVKSYTVGDYVSQALRGVSCRMPAGAVTIVQGPSGGGKSTLLNMVSGVDRPDSGSVFAGERDLTQMRSERDLSNYRLHDVGFVFQAFNLIPGLTAFDNLALPMTFAGRPRAEHQPRARALLDLVGLGEKGVKRPDELSGGEQQRVAIALALVNDPPLILADEPTGNLDTANSDAVTTLLRSLAHEFGKTVVITTHDPLVAARGDQVVNLRDGQLASSEWINGAAPPSGETQS